MCSPATNQVMSSKAGRERRREERLIFKKRYSKIPFFLEKKRGNPSEDFFYIFLRCCIFFET
jgi:hypothetical protein